MTRSSRILSASLLGLSLSLGALVSPAPARADEPTAAQLSDQAYARYEAGDYPSAVALYMKAYAINVDARILFNVAQIYDRKVQDRDLAIEYYRRYLKSTTTEVDLVRKATERVTELQRQLDDKPKGEPPPAAANKAPQGPAPAAPPPAAPPPAEERGASHAYWAGYATAGLFAAGAIVTGSLALSASSSLSSATYTGSTPPADVDSTATRSKALGITTDVLIGSAVVAAAVTLIVQLTASKSPPKAASALRAVAPGPTGLTWRF